MAKAKTTTTKTKAKTTTTTTKAKDQKVELTPEQIKAQKEKKAAKRKASKEKREALNAAKKTVREFMQSKPFTALAPNVQTALQLLAPAPRSGGAAKSSIKNMLAELFPKVGTVITELDLFKKTKMGPAEMRKKVQHALKKSAPEDRMWISYNTEKETWTLLAVGPDMPDGWGK